MIKKEIGTLAELSVKPGDVVECVGWSDDDSDFLVGEQYTIMEKHPKGFYDDLCAVRNGHSWASVDGSKMLFRIVSRAADTPKTWEEMTDEEKGALLLAEHRGKVIEWKHPQDMYDDWDTENLRFGISYMAYRVRPPEPKRETAVWWWEPECSGSRWYYDEATHRITLPLLDGNIPAGNYTSEAGETIIVEVTT